MKRDPWTSYDLWKTTPPELSDEELYIERKVEELSEDLEFLTTKDWFTECIDWDKVNRELTKEIQAQVQEDKAEAEIAAYEARQEYLENYYV